MLEESGKFTVAGVAAPMAPLYGEKFMVFSEFFHDITANITEVRPTNKAFDTSGSVAAPKKFINAGTRNGSSSTSK